MRAQRIVYALNPNSGQGLRGDDAIFAEGVELATGETFTQLHQATEHSLANGADVLIVQGGDGMASMGAELAAKHGIPLGVVPTGTGNDFARSVGIPRGKPGELRTRLISSLKDGTAKFRTVDLLRLEVDGVKRVAVNSVNIGFDALVNERANEKRHLRGTARYLVALVQSVRDFRSDAFSYAIDGGQPQSLDAEVVTVTNGRTVGGGIPLVPDARPDDGKLDVIVVSGLNRLGLSLLFPSALVGLHRFLPPVKLLTGTTARIDVPAGVPIYADGECIRSSDAKAGSTVEITIDPGALRLVRA
ncbi:diacylglycerol/lipid kinase family protein [Gulosibacter chungangensis]|uniref:DAGKc domain-containing protein n=1 Tax=Gulosibacter chungangensis TaxID=979746 RepID=A0A7J5B7Z8_9MICO|nr:diacylglycerol kinase family protein [Gulosibacter chungangensis]KAB1641207.1 hypothetical protein F8O05_13340 [Gulosibacter chungangensis]